MSSGKDPLNYINKRLNQGTTTASTLLKNTLGSKTYITDSNIREFVRLYVSGKKDQLPWDLRNLPIGKWYVVYVKNMSKVFKDCTTFNESLAGWDISQALNMDYMFENCRDFNQPIGDALFYTSNKVTSMQGMFKNCTLFNQNLRDFDTSNVTNMSEMFSGCEYFMGIGLETWDVRNVKNMSAMFKNCSRFNPPGVLSFDTSKVTNMSEMFYGCSLFQGVGLESWDVRNVKNMNAMFYDCAYLPELDSPSNFINKWDDKVNHDDIDTTDMFLNSNYDVTETVASFKEQNLEELPIAKPAPLNLLPQLGENITSFTGFTPKINTAELVPIGYGEYADGGKKRKTRKVRNGRKVRNSIKVRKGKNSRNSRKSVKKSRRRR